MRPEVTADDLAAARRGPRVGVWGTFDVANFGDLLFPRIFEHELRRRVPDATVRAYSPCGHLHPVSMSGGLRVEQLGRPTKERLTQLAAELDLVAIGGGDIIHPHDDLYSLWYEMEPREAEILRPSAFFVDGLGADLERSTPTAWHAVGVPFDLQGDFAKRVRRACGRRAYLAVRDEPSRNRLVAAGVEREVVLTPDSAFVVDRLFPCPALESRREALVAQGAYPRDAAPLVVQGGASLRAHLEEIGNALKALLAQEPDLPVVLVETGLCHGDDEFADALSEYLDPDRRYRLPRGFVVDDVVTAIAHARGFFGSSLHGCLSAYVFGRPFLVLDVHDQSKLSSLVDLTGEGELASSVENLTPRLRRLLGGRIRRDRHAHLRSLVDAHFDRLATMSRASLAEPATAGRNRRPLARLRAARRRGRGDDAV